MPRKPYPLKVEMENFSLRAIRSDPGGRPKNVIDRPSKAQCKCQSSVPSISTRTCKACASTRGPNNQTNCAKNPQSSLSFAVSSGAFQSIVFKSQTDSCIKLRRQLPKRAGSCLRACSMSTWPSATWNTMRRSPCRCFLLGSVGG